jgi:translocation and assembly module TamB
MPTDPAPTTTGRAGGARKRRARRALKLALAIVALALVAVAALVGYGLSERGLPFVVARIVAQTGGRISVEEPTGSVAGTMRFRRITWHGADVTVTADDVVVDWNPGALWSRRLSIRGLGARHVAIAIKPSSGATTPPTDLRLPLSVDIARLAVAELEWHTGPRSGSVSGLEFGYSGDATLHRIRDLRFVSDFGTLAGDLQVGTRAPLDVAGSARIDGDGPLAGLRIDGRLGGPLERIGIAAHGTLREAELSAQATATPFASAPFSDAAGELTGVDASSIDPGLPRTRARVHFTASPRGEGIAGTLDIVNDDSGPIDAGRFPVAQLAARFALANDVLQLDALDATLAGGGGARGEGRITLAGAQRAAHFALTIADLDLARIHTRLAATRLAGRLVADADADAQRIDGDVRERDMTLAFAASVANGSIDVRRFRASAAGGSLAGSARLSLADAHPFSVAATMQRLDPSRFAAIPSASLDGTVEASGTLEPQWQASARIVLAPTSRLAGSALSGTAKGTIASRRVRDATVDLALGSARLHADGAAGARGDRLAFTLDAPNVGEADALLPARVPRPLTGEIHATGNVAIGDDAIGGDVEWRARSLRVGAYGAGAVRGRASLAAPAAARAGIETRTLGVDVEATQVALGTRAIDAVRANVTGTLARHHATLALRGADFDATLALDGTLANPGRPDHTDWSGTLTAFENRGAVPIRLRGAATLALRAGYARLADARIDVADGRADIAEFVWDDGKLATRGAFTGIPLGKAARLAGRELPVETTLVFGGEWSIAAAPRLNGRFSVRRERGDVFAAAPADAAQRREALGVGDLGVEGTLADDALEARAAFASARAGSATATLAIARVEGAVSGRIDPAAPLRLDVRADLASLALFQPWIGTEAVVDGRAQLDVAARGTFGEPLWSGAIAGDALRVDALRYGVHVQDGRLRAHLEGRGIALDEFRFAGGDGTFTASGLIALPRERGGAPTHVTWKAERFRIANRPDLRFVIDGEGSVALADRRVALRGNIDIVEGHVEYDPSPSGQLAPDIVIAGQPAEERRSAARDVPLALDVDVDLGRALTFVGEGLDARLAGRVRVTTSASGALLGRGTVRAVNGTYIAFGQKLTLDRGRVIFDGPLDNPALDFVALRKNLAVEAGIALSGTVKVPQVRITSNPPVPENEALAWLITGQGLAGTGRADYAAISAASAALLGRHGKPFTAGIAQRFGLDDISLRSAGTSGAQGTASQVVVFGKRVSDKLSLGYEQGLSLASSALRLEYALSQRVTLRAEAGIVSGVSIVYRRNFR